jgi:LuxR family maltose regulon positive regulatory protein
VRDGKQPPLLMTKLYIPAVRRELVSRPRLIARLDAGLCDDLTLISAPAGFGKTTLLSEWISGIGSRALEHELMPAERSKSQTTNRKSQVRVAWVSLDEDDNDPVRFLAYLVAALQTIWPGIGEGVLGTFQASQPSPVRSVLPALINEITVASNPFVVVLDDYHVIKTQSIHDAVAFLVEHLPPQMHLVIATRSDPPLPITRMRGRGQVTELRQSDLRFTLDEVAEFLNYVLSLDLVPGDVAALASRTEGWIAGLQMAGVSLQAQADVTAFIQTFTGSDRYILDYLVEEVLQSQPEAVQTFLLQTSILDRLSGPLCDAVVGEIGDWGLEMTSNLQSPAPNPQSPISNSQSQAVLEHLDSSNLFIVPLDNERCWYRYHHLFADLLRQRLRQQVGPQAMACLHQRASAWYERHDLVSEAIEHAVSAEDFERAAYLIERAAETVLMRGEFASLLSWTEAMPKEMMRTRPLLAVYGVWGVLLGGRSLAEIESRLQDVIEGDVDGDCAGAITLLRSLIATYKKDVRRSIELGRQALEQIPEESLFFRFFGARGLGTAYLLSGDIAAAGQIFEEEVRISQKGGSSMDNVKALQKLATARAIQGRLREAETLYRKAHDIVIDREGRLPPFAAKVSIGLGDVLRESNHLEAATHYLLEAIEAARSWVEAYGMGGYMILARVRQAQGDVDGAREAIETAERLAVEYDATDLDDILVHACQARLWLAQGDLQAAIRWVRRRGLNDSGDPSELETGDSGGLATYHLLEIERITLARVRIAQGQFGKALAALRPLLQTAERLGRMASVIEILVLQAQVFQGQGDVSQALESLQRALYLAGPEGYVRVFADEGAVMADLLRQAAAQGIAVEYVRKLLAVFGGRARGDVFGSRSYTFTLIEPLSERELEVVRLLAVGLSNKEIAKTLVIAVGTVKKHLKNVYGKLDVHSRTQAVAQARDLGIL